MQSMLFQHANKSKYFVCKIKSLFKIQINIAIKTANKPKNLYKSSKSYQDV